jgi:hypothetical protein
MRTNLSGLRKSFLFLSSFFFLNTTGAFGQVVPRVVEAVDNAKRITLTGNVHPLARAEYDRGAVADAQPMTRILLLLKRSDEQEAALQEFMEQQQDKSSASYHQWLTPAEFGALYGPADADIQAVTQWLQSQGFKIEKVYSGKTVIEFSGTAGQVRTAFGAAIHNYQVGDKAYTANANDPQIPAALAPVVAGIVSLNNFPRKSHIRVAGLARKVAGKPGLEPLFTFPLPNNEGTFYGVGPGDFAIIYNSKGLIGSGNNGAGQTIAIVGETNINVADVQAFRRLFALPANFTSSNIILNGTDPGITSADEEGEADLDVEWSGAVAPGATVDLVVSASTQASAGVDLSVLYIVEHNLGGVMSESYGDCEANIGSAENAFYNTQWEQAAAQGITAMVSSGDGGSAGCDDFNSETQATLGLAVSGLASTPYNVAVGGTDFDQTTKWSSYWSTTNNSTTEASARSYIPEIPWNENCAQISLTGCTSNPPNDSVNIVAGSGGPSNTYGKPEWQLGVLGMPNDNHRDLPDVSLFASPGFDYSGYIMCAGNGVPSTTSQCDLTAGQYYFSIAGGTSASSPAFAGILALVNQYQAAHGGTNRQGNANPVLYALAKQTGASCTSSVSEGTNCIFNDVTHGNSYVATEYGSSVGTNSVSCTGGSPNCSAIISSETGVLVDPNNPTTEAWTVTPGYDMATGLGSVNVNSLVTKWGTASTVATTTSLTLAPTTGITHGTTENVGFTVNVTPKSGTATGGATLIAEFTNGTTTTTQDLDQFTLSGGTASGTTNSLPGGTNYSVFAHYDGDGTNAPSDSAPVSVTVAPEGSKTFLVIPTYAANGNLVSGNASTAVYGSKYLFQMYVTNSAGAASTTGPPSPLCRSVNALSCPTGSVLLTDGGNAVDAGTFTLNSAGYGQDSAPYLAGGTHSLSAQYSGDNSYNGSQSVATMFTVTPGPTQTQINGYPASVLQGYSFQLMANVVTQALGGANPGGTVTFYDGNTALPGTVSLTPSGGVTGSNAYLNASISTSFSSSGPQTITASYSGDSNYATSTSNPITISSLIPTAMTQSESTTTITLGQSITVTVNVTSNSKNPPMTGQVLFNGPPATFTNVTTTAGTDANGNQMLTATAMTSPQTSEYISASYPGDTNYASASTVPVIITVNIPDFTLGPANGVSVVPVAGQPGSGQITITPVSSSQPTSTVTLALTGPVGMSGYTIALSPQQVSLNGAAATAAITLTPTVSVPASAIRSEARRAGFLAVKRDNWWLLSLASGLGVLFMLGLPGRRRRWRAALGLSVACLLFLALGCGGGVTTPQPTSITLTTTNAKVAQGASFTITATVTASKPLTGTISFCNFGLPIAIALTPVNSQAQMGQANIDNPGVYQITASYSGDSNNLASTSAPLIQVITGTMPISIQGNTSTDVHTLQATLGVQ